MSTVNMNFRLLDIKAVCKKVSLGKTTILLWESATKFPLALRLSAGKRLWVESDIDEWILSHRNSANLTQEFK